MNQQEFNAWMTETERSEDEWCLDYIPWANRGELLFYQGGTEAGQYLWIFADGTASIGTYTGAIPHIGDACFTPGYSRKVGGNASESFAYIIERLGLRFLADLMIG